MNIYPRAVCSYLVKYTIDKIMQDICDLKIKSEWVHYIKNNGTCIIKCVCVCVKTLPLSAGLWPSAKWQLVLILPETKGAAMTVGGKRVCEHTSLGERKRERGVKK